MLGTPRLVPTVRPHIIVVGNHKGGSGKTTLAMHIIVALLKQGTRVASFDLDRRQQTLSRYIENRREWAGQKKLALELPRHFGISAAANGLGSGNDATTFAAFLDGLKDVQHHCDFIVIDTPGGDDHLSLLAHGMADTLITPINDSFIDLDAIMMIGPTKDFEPSCYAETVTAARRGRDTVSSRPMDWIVVRNRLAAPSTSGQEVAQVLELKAGKIGYRTAPGLSERLVYRAFFPIGATALDMLDDMHLGCEPNMSHLLARMEVRQLMEAVGLGFPSQADDETEAPERPPVRLVSDAPPAIGPQRSPENPDVRLPPATALDAALAMGAR